MQNFKIGHRTKQRDTVDCFLKIAFSNDVLVNPHSVCIFYARNGINISHDMQHSTFYVFICSKDIYKKICVNNIKFGACRLYL